MAKSCIIFSAKHESGHENSSWSYSTYSGHFYYSQIMVRQTHPYRVLRKTSRKSESC
jgi:hypothetical protein